MTARGLDEQVNAVVRQYRLAAGPVHARRGRIGAQRGSGPGSSLDFHDFRDYAPGDDLRHVDWRGYARTDQLRVRLHEAEVAPVVEVLVDTSASMAVTERKRDALAGVVRALCGWARADGSLGRALALGGGLLDDDGAMAAAIGVGPRDPAPPQLPLRRGAVRVVVTDGLWPVAPPALLRRLAAGASRFVVLQLLDPDERDPAGDGAVTLVDCESGARGALQLDAAALRVYRERLKRLCADLYEQVVRLGGVCEALTADDLETMCRRDLLPARIVEPA